MQGNKLHITAIPAFDDNYIWLLTAGGKACAVVDPGDEDPVLEVLKQRGLDLRYILLTHHHYDHTGGVTALLDHYQATVFGPADDRMSFVDHVCRDGDQIQLPELDVAFRVLEVPAHTRSHIAYYGENAVFSGDTLFSLGCGRFFEGTATDMQKSMDKLAVRHSFCSDRCIDACYPQPPELALAVVTIASGIVQRVKHRLIRTPKQTMALAFVALSQ